MRTTEIKIAAALLAFFLTATSVAIGQKSLTKLVSVSVDKVELRQVLKLIQAQTGVQFTYSSDVVNVSQKISCRLVQKKLGHFLDTQLSPLGIEYRTIDEEQILLFTSPEKKKENRSLISRSTDLLFSVSAKVTDEAGEPLVGVSVIEKGTNNGATTDNNGVYHLTVHEDAVLLFSLVGYNAKEIKAGNVRMFNVTLSEKVKPIDEIVVTGVFDKRKRNESSISVTTLNALDIEKQNPVSAADILTNVPGVYVNSSLGEIRNVVYSRGISANSTDAASGYYYVSLQEDGLPVTNVTFSNFGPDYFYRPDASLNRVEAVRGGTASVLGANAPAGIFNYISKTGGEETTGEVKTRVGLEGKGNGYYRSDVNVGGPLNNRGWYYNGGGFYRYSLGARYPGYPLNFGGQIKGNLVKKSKAGLLKFYFKYLNDHNGWFEFLPAKNFDHPQLAPGVQQTDSYLLPDVSTAYPFQSASVFKTFDPTTLVYSKELAIGQSIERKLGNHWKITNNLKYSRKAQDWQSSSLVYPLSVDNEYLYHSLGLSDRKGIYTFKDKTTGDVLAQTQTTNGIDFNVLNSKLPGAGILPNGILRNVGLVHNTHVSEWMDQFSVTKKWKKMSFTGGVYYGLSMAKRKSSIPATGLSVLQNRPQLLDVTLTDSSGKQFKITDPKGYANLGNGYMSVKAQQNDLAVFFGHTWQANQNWTLDWGVRYGHIAENGYNEIDVPNEHANEPSFGGADGDPATLYDNKYYVPGARYRFAKSVNTLSYSVAVNYKINNRFAFYGSYANGQKAPDLGYYFAYDSETKTKNDKPKPQKIHQAEIGVMIATEKVKLFFTPFYSLLRDVYSLVAFQGTAGDVYFPPTQYNRIETHGIEMETDYSFSSRFTVHAIASVQAAKTKDWKVWVANAPGAQDDQLVNYSRKKADNNPDVLLNVTPSYTTDRLNVFASWKYMGNRPGNVPNTIVLPGFSQFNVGSQYKLNKRLRVSAAINNLFNANGVMGWSAPNVRGAALDRQGFTQELRDANPNATFGIICIQPRAYFFTVAYSF